MVGDSGGIVGSGVFINYRSADSRSYGALLHAELSRQLGLTRVFLDSESIPAGSDFATELLGRVRCSRVLLAVIGPRWLADTGPDGRSIDDADDWIRRELVEAFTAGVTVIPVLTDEADLPTAEELPADIADLAGRQYRRLRHRDASTDIARIVGDVVAADPDLAADPARGSGRTPLWLAATARLTGLMAVGLLALSLVIAAVIVRPGQPSASTGGTSQSAGRPWPPPGPPPPPPPGAPPPWQQACPTQGGQGPSPSGSGLPGSTSAVRAPDPSGSGSPTVRARRRPGTPFRAI